jgi:outer membrane immunogenic protein
MRPTALFQRAFWLVLMLVIGAAAARASEPQRLYSWTGAYIGVTAGYGWGDSRYDDGMPPDRYVTVPFDIDGAVVGGTLGYNLQLRPGIVAGVEADLSYADISGSFGPGWLSIPGDAFNCATICSSEVNWFGTLRGRFGFATENLMVYATGGLAFGGVRSSVHLPNWKTSDTNFGWTAGAGVEYVLRPGWTAKLEYLHVDLGWTDGNIFPFQGDPADIRRFRSEAVFDVVRVGLNYRLGN